MNNNISSEVEKERRKYVRWAVWLANYGHVLFFLVALYKVYFSDLYPSRDLNLEGFLWSFGFISVGALLSISPVMLSQSKYVIKRKVLIAVPVVAVLISAYGFYYSLVCSGKLCEIGGYLLIVLSLGSLSIFGLFYYISKLPIKLIKMFPCLAASLFIGYASFVLMYGFETHFDWYLY